MKTKLMLEETLRQGDVHQASHLQLGGSDVLCIHCGAKLDSKWVDGIGYVYKCICAGADQEIAIHRRVQELTETLKVFNQELGADLEEIARPLFKESYIAMVQKHLDNLRAEVDN